MSKEKLRRKINITKYARFQANLRLSRRNNTSSYFVSLMSLYVVGLSIYPNFAEPELSKVQSQMLLAASIVLSVFIIIVSLSEASKNFYHRGEMLFASARDLGKLQNKLESYEESDPDLREKLDDIAKEYSEILNQCPFNHDDIDYIRVQAMSPHLFPDRYSYSHKALNYCVKILLWVRVYSMENSGYMLPIAVVIAITIGLWIKIWS